MATIKKYNGSTWENAVVRKYGTASEIITPPTTIYADGTAITAYTLKGNEEHTGTPSPQNPVMPNGVGERTENWFDKESAVTYNAYIDASGYWITSSDSRSIKINVLPNTQYTLSVSDTLAVFRIYQSDNSNIQPASATTVQLTEITRGTEISQYTFTTGSTAKCIVFQGSASAYSSWFNSLMLNIGSTAKSYEPYGYKIPISNGDVTTNIYLGSTQSERKIKKYVFTGNETVYSCVKTADNNNYCCGFRFSDIGWTDILDYEKLMKEIDYPVFVSSHFTEKTNTVSLYNNIQPNECGANSLSYAASAADRNHYIIFCVAGLTTAAEYSAWFAQQYANGTPVTLYYILDTATTAAVNEPLMKIGTYADTLSNAASIPTTEGANSITVDTTVQPSEFTATWTGWHDASVKEWDGSQWD